MGKVLLLAEISMKGILKKDTPMVKGYILGQPARFTMVTGKKE
jgi:hypothetical protein